MKNDAHSPKNKFKGEFMIREPNQYLDKSKKGDNCLENFDKSAFSSYHSIQEFEDLNSKMNEINEKEKGI